MRPSAVRGHRPCNGFAGAGGFAMDSQTMRQGPCAQRSRSRTRGALALRGRRRPRNQRAPNSAEGPARGYPLRAFFGAIEKRPPRARRPALPQPGAAVLSAKAGLTAGFGMGPGDPRLCGRARGGRSPAALIFEPARYPFTGATLAAAWRARKKMTHRARCFNRGCEELGLLVPLG